MSAQPQRFDDLLAETGRPLLRLVQHLTGMETSFITSIDWDEQSQDVVLSLNTGAILVEEGGRVSWSQSLCRSMFVSGRLQSANIVHEVAGTEVAKMLGMRSFFALPIQSGDSTIGTFCGASAQPVELDDRQMQAMELIAESLCQQLETHRQQRR